MSEDQPRHIIIFGSDPARRCASPGALVVFDNEDHEIRVLCLREDGHLGPHEFTVVWIN